jgi:hypothetical protein
MMAAEGISVAVTCRVLELARQPYYCWLANAVTDAQYGARSGDGRVLAS